jgi:hypothetical protein
MVASRAPLQALNPASGITIVFSIFAVLRLSFVAEKWLVLATFMRYANLIHRGRTAVRSIFSRLRA